MSAESFRSSDSTSRVLLNFEVHGLLDIWSIWEKQLDYPTIEVSAPRSEVSLGF